MTEVLSVLGQYYSIDCITGPVPTGVSVSWILTNGSIYSNTNTLVISSILPSHSNTNYTCLNTVLSNPIDCMTQSQTIAIILKGKIYLVFMLILMNYIESYIKTVIVIPSSVVSDINSSVLITCTITLNTMIGPDTSFITHYWYYNNNTDITSRSIPLMISGEGTSLITTLNISSVQPSDVGLYECRASIDKNNTQIKNTTHLCAKG